MFQEKVQKEQCINFSANILKTIELWTYTIMISVEECLLIENLDRILRMFPDSWDGVPWCADSKNSI